MSTTTQPNTHNGPAGRLPTPASEPHLHGLNEDYALVMAQGQVHVISQTRHGFQYMKPGDFELFHATTLIWITDGAQVKQRPLGTYWLREWPQRRTHPDVDFLPEPAGTAPTPPKNGTPFNLWSAWGAAPSHGDTAIFHRHLLEHICVGNREHYDYVLDWLADLVQHPADIPGVSVVLRGEPGAGKGRFARVITDIVGSAHSQHITDNRMLTSRFQASMATSLFIFADESVWGGDKTTEQVLKGIISEEDAQVEDKYVRSFKVRNCRRYLFASNLDWAVPVANNDRRYFVLDVAMPLNREAKAQFFSDYEAWRKSGGPGHLLHELMQRPIGPRLPPMPYSVATASIKREAMPVQEEFLFNLLAGDIYVESASPTDGHNTWTGDFTRRALFAAYTDWCKETSKRHYGTQAQFFPMVHRIFPQQGGTKWKKDDRLVILGLLEEARAQFARFYQVAKFDDLFA